MGTIRIFLVFEATGLGLLHMTYVSTTFSPAVLTKKATASLVLDFLLPLA